MHSDEGATRSATVRPPAQWSDERLGASKRLLDFEWLPSASMDRPTELDECVVEVSEWNAACAACASEFLRELQSGIEGGGDAGNEATTIRVALRRASTGFDCVLAAVLRHMWPGERSRVRIERRQQSVADEHRHPELTIRLVRICPAEQRHWHQLQPAAVAALAAEQRALGVALYRQQETGWAHWTFARAARAMCACKPFDKIAGDAARAAEWQRLFESVCVNLAACLVRARRWEDVLYVLREVTERDVTAATGDGGGGGCDAELVRAIYRRAVAHFNLRQLDEARAQIERLEWQTNGEQRELRERIVDEQAVYQAEYSTMVKKMFKA